MLSLRASLMALEGHGGPRGAGGIQERCPQTSQGLLHPGMVLEPFSELHAPRDIAGHERGPQTTRIHSLTKDIRDKYLSVH